MTRTRTAVERSYSGEPLFPHALEYPTRFAKQLIGLLRGGTAIGMTAERALTAALRCAHDSVPPIRLTILRYVADHPDAMTAEW